MEEKPMTEIVATSFSNQRRNTLQPCYNSVMGFSSIKSVFAKPTLLEKPYFITFIFGEGIVILSKV